MQGAGPVNVGLPPEQQSLLRAPVATHLPATLRAERPKIAISAWTIPEAYGCAFSLKFKCLQRLPSSPSTLS